jgi:RHS repeat-associated protein
VATVDGSGALVNAYRLTSATYPGPLTTTYAYDAFGNRTQMVNASGTTAYAYDNSSRLTTVTPPSPGTPVAYTWDNNGNLTARGTDTFSWDPEDRMTSDSVGGVASSFDYRGDGLRNSRTTGGTTTTFTWDVAAGLPVIIDDGAQYVYGAGLVAQVSGSNTYYYLADGLGSVMATVDGSGTLANAYTYDVYGKTTTASGSQANDFQFAGQQTDPTGLQYLRARYYDPATGGFLGRDPLAKDPAWPGQPLGYAGANPVNNLDPTGLCFGPKVFCRAASGARDVTSHFVERQIDKHLHDEFTILSDLQTIMLFVTSASCGVGAYEACFVGALAYGLLWYAKTDVLRARQEAGTMSRNEAVCRNVTDAPWPFPVGLIAGSVCTLIGATSEKQ